MPEMAKVISGVQILQTMITILGFGPNGLPGVARKT
jgi:hypothetical protein